VFNLKKARKYQRGLSYILNFGMMVDPGVMLGKDGSLTAGWWVEGEDLTSRTRQEIDAVANRLNSVLNRLDNGWCIQHHAVRRPAMDYPDATFPDPVSKIMDDERREHFESEGQHYTTMLAVTATYLPPLRGKG